MDAFYYDYSPVGDVLVMTICIIFVILFRAAYINRTRSFILLRRMIFSLFASAAFNTIFHMLIEAEAHVPHIIPYGCRFIHYIGLYFIMWTEVMYFREILRLQEHSNRLYFAISTIAFDLLIILEVLGTVLHFGFYIDADEMVHRGFPLFPFAYVFYTCLLLYLLIRHRDRIFKQIMLAVISTVVLSFLIILIQQHFGEASFTAATYLFPIFTLLYLIHSNPYDLNMGAVGMNAFNELISSSHKQRKKLFLMSLLMMDFEGSGRQYPAEVLDTVKYFTACFFKKATLFRISGGLVILVASEDRDPDYMEGARKMLKAFDDAYEKFRLDYKIVYCPLFDEVSESNDYVGLIRFMHGRMKDNSFHVVNEEDVRIFEENKYILNELADINSKNDLDDPRVLVYCQPVYNIGSGAYDTAEALMRLQLSRLGMVGPDRFIHLAEQHQYIQALTRIILNKTCKMISELNEGGYDLKRISVNFSTFDIRDPNFCYIVEKIIKRHSIAFNQVAIEITETQNEQDFSLIQERMEELKDSGIKFYLDDFGTGYSNFERIMELPFDIIKFDRSLVVASDNDEKMKAMVSHLASMFNDMQYSVLYEGVENDSDEQRCVSMSARYLQGFKYSRPIPIERLSEFLKKKEG